MDYKNFNDYELIYMVRENSEIEEDYLFNKYKPLINKIATKYINFVKSFGGDYDDLMQEGFIGLHSAVESYNESMRVLFYTFSSLCIERRMKRYCKGLVCKKNMYLNTSVDYDLLSNKLISNKYEPSNLVIDKSIDDEFLNYKYMFSFKLSNVFELKYNGFNYKEISLLLDVPVSTIDSRLCKIKSKLKNIIKVN